MWEVDKVTSLPLRLVTIKSLTATSFAWTPSRWKMRWWCTGSRPQWEECGLVLECSGCECGREPQTRDHREWKGTRMPNPPWCTVRSLCTAETPPREMRLTLRKGQTLTEICNTWPCVCWDEELFSHQLNLTFVYSHHTPICKVFVLQTMTLSRPMCVSDTYSDEPQLTRLPGGNMATQFYIVCSIGYLMSLASQHVTGL